MADTYTFLFFACSAVWLLLLLQQFLVMRRLRALEMLLEASLIKEDC